jgi:hypothetical protein
MSEEDDEDVEKDLRDGKVWMIGFELRSYNRLSIAIT